MANGLNTFSNLEEVASHLRERLEEKKYILLFAYNGTGKTRLSMEFKDIGKKDNERDTLYFNAYTEDLFYWDNDLEEDFSREFRLNTKSRFFAGLAELEMDTRIRRLLHRYVDFDFKILNKEIEEELNGQIFKRNVTYVSFERKVVEDGKEKILDHIKVSRGEENIFIWCFFLAVVQLALDGQKAYEWVKFIYIDDPISSLDDNNTIAVASHLANLLKDYNGKIKTIVSSHHALFYNVMCNEWKNSIKYMLCSHDGIVKYTLKDTTDTPYFHHIAMLKTLVKAARRDELYTYHFSMLRNILEKSASFHGFDGLSNFIKQDKDDQDGVLHHRIIQLLNHGGYSHFEPKEMVDENKQHFKNILNNFLNKYGFNPELISNLPETNTE
jgi:AAA domain-containing protein